MRKITKEEIKTISEQYAGLELDFRDVYIAEDFADYAKVTEFQDTFLRQRDAIWNNLIRGILSESDDADEAPSVSDIAFPYEDEDDVGNSWEQTPVSRNPAMIEDAEINFLSQFPVQYWGNILGNVLWGASPSDMRYIGPGLAGVLKNRAEGKNIGNFTDEIRFMTKGGPGNESIYDPWTLERVPNLSAVTKRADINKSPDDRSKDVAAYKKENPGHGKWHASPNPNWSQIGIKGGYTSGENGKSEYGGGWGAANGVYAPFQHFIEKIETEIGHRRKNSPMKLGSVGLPGGLDDPSLKWDDKTLLPNSRSGKRTNNFSTDNVLPFRTRSWMPFTDVSQVQHMLRNLFLGMEQNPELFDRRRERVMTSKFGQVHGFDLVIKSLNKATAMPKGKLRNTVVVGDVNGVLHFTIFDDRGKPVVATNETRLGRSSNAIRNRIANLKKTQEIQKQEVPTINHRENKIKEQSDKNAIISMVMSLVGYDPNKASQPVTQQDDEKKYTRNLIGSSGNRVVPTTPIQYTTNIAPRGEVVKKVKDIDPVTGKIKIRQEKDIDPATGRVRMQYRKREFSRSASNKNDPRVLERPQKAPTDPAYLQKMAAYYAQEAELAKIQGHPSWQALDNMAKAYHQNFLRANKLKDPIYQAQSRPMSSWRREVKSPEGVTIPEPIKGAVVRRQLPNLYILTPIVSRVVRLSQGFLEQLKRRDPNPTPQCRDDQLYMKHRKVASFNDDGTIYSGATQSKNAKSDYDDTWVGEMGEAVGDKANVKKSRKNVNPWCWAKLDNEWRDGDPFPPPGQVVFIYTPDRREYEIPIMAAGVIDSRKRHLSYAADPTSGRYSPDMQNNPTIFGGATAVPGAEEAFPIGDENKHKINMYGADAQGNPDPNGPNLSRRTSRDKWDWEDESGNTHTRWVIPLKRCRDRGFRHGLDRLVRRNKVNDLQKAFIEEDMDRIKQAALFYIEKNMDNPKVFNFDNSDKKMNTLYNSQQFLTLHSATALTDRFIQSRIRDFEKFMIDNYGEIRWPTHEVKGRGKNGMMHTSLKKFSELNMKEMMDALGILNDYTSHIYGTDENGLPNKPMFQVKIPYRYVRSNIDPHNDLTQYVADVHGKTGEKIPQGAPDVYTDKNGNEKVRPRHPAIGKMVYLNVTPMAMYHLMDQARYLYWIYSTSDMVSKVWQSYIRIGKDARPSSPSKRWNGNPMDGNFEEFKKKISEVGDDTDSESDDTDSETRTSPVPRAAPLVSGRNRMTKLNDIYKKAAEAMQMNKETAKEAFKADPDDKKKLADLVAAEMSADQLETWHRLQKIYVAKQIRNGMTEEAALAKWLTVWEKEMTKYAANKAAGIKNTTEKSSVTPVQIFNQIRDGVVSYIEKHPDIQQRSKCKELADKLLTGFNDTELVHDIKISISEMSYSSDEIDFFQDFISLFVLDKILDLKKSGKLNVVKLTKFRDNLLSEKLCRKMSFCMDVIISDLSKGQVA